MCEIKSCYSSGAKLFFIVSALEEYLCIKKQFLPQLHFIYFMTLTSIFRLGELWLWQVFYFCVLAGCHARSTVSFQKCSRCRETEFPTMLGTQYALTRAAVRLQRSLQRSQTQSNSACGVLLRCLRCMSVLSRCVCVCVCISAVALRVSVWKQRPGWQPGMSWCPRRTRVTPHTATTSARVRHAVMCRVTVYICMCDVT